VSTRIVIVGGGIVGCATAYYGARAGARVTLLEREQVAYGASGRNPGFVWVHCRNPGFALEISLATRRLYPELAEELPGGFELRTNGGVIYFVTEEQGAAFEQFVAARRGDGLQMELIDGQDVRRLVPPIREDVLGASFCPDDAQINTPNFVRALAAGARREGAEIREGVAVTGVRRSGDEVVGVTTVEGTLDADVVVAAAGAWTGELLRDIGIELPIGAERLQVVATEPLPLQIQPVVYGPLATKQYDLWRSLPAWHADDFTAECERHSGIEVLQLVAQRASGEVLMGCPMDYPPELDLRPTLDGLATAMRAVRDDFPGLRDAPIDRVWAGLLPYTTDTEPIIDLAAPGLYVASGHVYGNAAGPMTGKLVAQLALGEEPDLDLSSCRIDRVLTAPSGTAERW
jgi:glycine/D-amino acid oxidase-like deaminating enzyme